MLPKVCVERPDMLLMLVVQTACVAAIFCYLIFACGITDTVSAYNSGELAEKLSAAGVHAKT